MLPAPARLRRREDFTLAVRRGRRSGRGTLVAHYLASASPGLPARAGFVVGRAVGNSVVRHRTIRQLRHLVRDRLGRLPAGSVLVIRALPPSATADSAALGRDLDAALTRLLPPPAGARGEVTATGAATSVASAAVPTPQAVPTAQGAAPTPPVAPIAPVPGPTPPAAPAAPGPAAAPVAVGP